jgi:hypothetical protein
LTEVIIYRGLTVGRAKKSGRNEKEEKKVGSWGATDAKANYSEDWAGRKQTPAVNQGSLKR